MSEMNCWKQTFSLELSVTFAQGSDLLCTVNRRASYNHPISALSFC
jgi:hypothetical protein